MSVVEAYAWSVLFIDLEQGILGMGLNWYNSVKFGSIPIKDTDRMFDLQGEIGDFVSVYDVDFMVSPFASGGSWGENDPHILLLSHPVHVVLSPVDRNQLLGVLNNDIRGGIISKIYVVHDSNIPVHAKVDFHLFIWLCFLLLRNLGLKFFNG